MVPFGASEDPVSPHYDDQMKLIQERRLKPTRFEADDVRRNARSAYGSVVHVSPPGMESEFTVHADNPVAVTTKMTTKPATPIPSGLATFTVYATIDQQPADQKSLVEMKIFVPEEVCTQGNLSQLAIYGYDATQGWAPLQAQELDPDTRTITARDRGPRTYAVLGPSAARIAVNPFARQMIAKAIPDPKPLIAEAEKNLAPPQSAAAPVTPPVDMVAKPSVPTQEPQTPPVTAPDSPAPASPAPDAVAPPAPTDPSQQTPNEPAPSPAPLVDTASNMKAIEPPQAAPAKDSKRTMPVMQMGLPTAPVAAGAKQGALAFGKKMQLRPPGVEGIVIISADKQVGARLVVFPEPEQPLPGGLGAFTKFVRVEVQSEGAAVDVTVHLRAPEDGLPTAGLAALKLYAFDSSEGWVVVADQKVDQEKRDFSAKDSAPRTYALLGPGGLIQQQASAR